MRTSFRASVLTAVGQALDQVAATGSGRTIVFEGPAGAGLTTLLGLAVAGCRRSAVRPAIIAGGFDSGNFRPWSKAQSPVNTGDTLTLAGQALATAAAAAAIADPTGIVKTVTGVTALLGQAGQTAGAVHQVAAKPADPPQRSPQELFHEVTETLQTGGPVVLVLDDAHLAAPQLEWSALFLGRWLAEILPQQPLLLLIGGRASPSGELDEYRAAIDRLGERAGLVEEPVAFLSAAEIHDWLGNADPLLAADLHAVSGGHPGWVTTVFAGHRRRAVVKRAAGDQAAWRYTTNGRDQARQTADVQLQILLSRLFPDLGEYDRALSIMRAAALEGREFTTQALAAALGEQHDDMVDWIDERLSNDEAALFEEVGFRTLPAATRYGSPERHMLRYRFSSSMLWYAAHPVYKDGDPQSDPALQALCAAYLNGLVDAYGPGTWLVARTASMLARLAGDPDRSRNFELTADSAATRETQIAVVRGEIARHRSQPDVTDAEALASLRRLAVVCSALEGSTADGTDLQGGLLALDLSVALAATPLAASAQPHLTRVCALLGRVAIERACYGDAIFFHSNAAAMYLASGDLTQAVDSTFACANAMAVCVVLAQNRDDLAAAVQRRLRPAVDLLVAVEFAPDPATVDPVLLEQRFFAVLDEGSALVDRIDPPARSALRSQRARTLAVLRGVQRRHREAVFLLLSVLPFDQEGTLSHCQTLASLGTHMRMSGDAGAVEVCLRAARGLLRLGRRLGCTTSLLDLSLALEDAGQHDKAEEILRHTLLLSARTHEDQVFPIAAGSLAEAMLAAPGGRSAGMLLRALAAVLERLTVDELSSEVGTSPGEAARLLDQASSAMRADYGVGLLQALLGVSVDDNDNFLARL